MSKNNLCNEICRIMFIKTTAKSKLNSVNFQLGSLRMAQFVKIPFIVFRLARSIFRYYLNYCFRTQYTIPTNDLCHETWKYVEFMFIKMTPKSKFLLAHLKMAQLVKIPFIVFHLARLIFTGQTSRLDIVYPRHSSVFRTFYLSRDTYTRTVMAL